MSMWYRLKRALRESGERTENPKNCPVCCSAGVLNEFKGGSTHWFRCECSDRSGCLLLGPLRTDSQGAIEVRR